MGVVGEVPLQNLIHGLFCTHLEEETTGKMRLYIIQGDSQTDVGLTNESWHNLLPLHKQVYVKSGITENVRLGVF